MKGANDFLKDFEKNIMGNMNVCKMGKVNAFYPHNMTVDVTPMPSEDSAMILNVPIATINTANFLIYYPLQVGDNVILLFADNDTDNIMLGQDNIQSERKHDISDCICLGGFSLFKDSLNVSNTNGLVIQNKSNTAKISITEGGAVEIHSENITITGKAEYNGREIAVKGDSTSDGAVIV